MDPKRRFTILAKAKKPDNMDHIYQRSVKSFPTPITEPRLSYGFETNTEPKLIALLSDPSEEKRLSSLSLLYTHIANHEKIIRVLQFGIMDPLVVLLKDENPVARQRSAAILSRIAVVHVGVESILKHETAFNVILSCVKDENADICVTVHSIINLICSTMFVENAVERGVIPVLIQALPSATSDGQLLALDSLYSCCERMESAIHISIEEGLVALLVALFKQIDGVTAEVIERAASVLTVISGHVDGKRVAIEDGSVEVLVNILKEKKIETRTTINILESLMAITTNLDGQRIAVECGLCEILMETVQNEHPQLTLNSIKTIANLAINPAGRERLQGVLPSLRLLSSLPDLLIAESAREAITRVEWVP
ncbi:uncharacterized protein MONOS_922 [Monocercomonoides exilis]|uniref:uncharacterized protein n=1 Tax=Monocercomonoides exilis TaxID=2049356 RepID=UPI003559D29C|nr:hypothetical protein MONOS_922 [Monocercomonoides exilis]|eukprot:MONOS_922.1-p1 / transcript=MONOS_922.1 / gene=MONOS_922 / organism=Monocercomonoides_exilis_PA203 / gene_product=unspecified product / transcript_product=unspecified product / location=Mono_scaffold00015:146870-148906(+) / protein_length=368 / sequence_SO=supercontig / SO=protein_coding / is_pseudo=false